MFFYSSSVRFVDLTNPKIPTQQKLQPVQRLKKRQTKTSNPDPEDLFLSGPTSTGETVLSAIHEVGFR